MKNIFAFLFIVGTLTTQGQVKNALFIGNSYTGVNNLPLLIKNIALSFGDTLNTDANTPGGYQLTQHTTDATTLSKIASQNWDHVVIQEQSQKPSFSPAQVATDVYPYAEILCDSIRSNYFCSEPVFYMTWGRKNSDPGPCASGLISSCTYAGMQQRLRESYMEMSVDNNATVSPVGVAWKTARDSFPNIELYSPDESHPSIQGSYLAACVFYATFYQKSPIGSQYLPAGISNSEAYFLQTVASSTVLDSLALWGINTNNTIANFNYTGVTTINFTNTSTNGTSYHWNFGDGNTSTNQNPTHTYTSNGIYNVTLTTYDSDTCYFDEMTQIVNITITGIDAIDNQNKLTIYPNPVNDFIELKTTLKYTSITIVDITGKTIKQVQSQTKIDVSSLFKGIYFIQLIGKENTIVKKFVKE